MCKGPQKGQGSRRGRRSAIQVVEAYYRKLAVDYAAYNRFVAAALMALDGSSSSSSSSRFFDVVSPASCVSPGGRSWSEGRSGEVRLIAEGSMRPQSFPPAPAKQLGVWVDL